MVITLEDIKNRPLNEAIYEKFYRTLELGDKHNIGVYRYRVDKGDVNSILDSMVGSLAHPNTNDDILDTVRCYYEDKIFTDEEWNELFIPTINEVLHKNDTFVRWFPGYLLREKKTGKLVILQYDYATAFWGRDFTSLDICELDKDGEIHYSWAWANYNNYELVDDSHCQENIKKIRDYHMKYGHHTPYYLSSEIEKMYFV